MRRYLPYVIASVLLLAFYFIAKNPSNDDAELRLINESIQSDYNRLRMDYLNSVIDQHKYIEGVKKLANREKELFNEVKAHKFENVTESNYWQRGRLKFPSNIQIEIERIYNAQKDSVFN